MKAASIGYPDQQKHIHMIRIILLLNFISITAFAQDENWNKPVEYNKTQSLDSLTYKLLTQKATLSPSTNAPVSFIANDYINNLMKSFTYWTAFYENHPTTLYIFPNAKSSADSILVAENSDNKYVFKRSGHEWLMMNFSIKVSGFTLNHVACGQSSKEALKKMNIKLKKPITDGQVWVSNKSGTYKFLLTFTDDKLTRIQL